MRVLERLKVCGSFSRSWGSSRQIFCYIVFQSTLCVLPSELYERSKRVHGKSSGTKSAALFIISYFDNLAFFKVVWNVCYQIFWCKTYECIRKASYCPLYYSMKWNEINCKIIWKNNVSYFIDMSYKQRYGSLHRSPAPPALMHLDR